eukprot:TRINITY_DN14253_c0_g1_i1.p2 TRINITY_DN14253_c0_g1~~TRINITY_DN14253_c0_g1_i1.p2  ORF type:complete len:358 (-),score=27.14 TRINITY_DN14253_c0_g1_i1:383-1456(-)
MIHSQMIPSPKTLQNGLPIRNKTFGKRKRVHICQASSLNPYKTLGVESGANEKEVRTAYRKLALKYHPDVNRDENANDKFMEVQRAYEILTGKVNVEEGMSRGQQGVKGWDFHDWYWSFSMKARRAKSGQAQAKVDFQTEEKKTQVRSQLAGLKQRAAQRKQQQQYQTQRSTPIQSVQQDYQHKQQTDQTPQQTPISVDEQTNKQREFRQRLLRGLSTVVVIVTASFQTLPRVRMSNVHGQLVNTNNDIYADICGDYRQFRNRLQQYYFVKPYVDAFAFVFTEFGSMSMEEEFNQVMREQQTQNRNSQNEQDVQQGYDEGNQQSYVNYGRSFRHDENQVRSQLAGLKRKASLKQMGV